MSSTLRIFPFQSASAIDNMALDATLLELADADAAACLRFYGWAEPAFTFGYSQAWATIEQSLPTNHVTCLRRLTGGGIVDHRADLTYALALPRNHPLASLNATRFYQALHALWQQCLQSTLQRPFALAPCPGPCATPRRTALACFSGAEPFDVIDAVSSAKVAGAALKRNQRGLLVQGSVCLPPAERDNPALQTAFAAACARWLDATAQQCAAPPAVSAQWQQHFAAPTWNTRR